jgi:hypothetical protein
MASAYGKYLKNLENRYKDVIATLETTNIKIDGLAAFLRVNEGTAEGDPFLALQNDLRKHIARFEEALESFKRQGS